MDDKLLSNLEYLISAFAGVVARVEALRGRMSEAGRQEGVGCGGDRRECRVAPTRRKAARGLRAGEE